MVVAQDKDFPRRIQQIEGLIREIEETADPAARARSEELVRLLLELHGAGLERMLEIAAEAGEPGLTLIDGIARDQLAGSLLLLHGLHPLEVDARVEQALESVRPYLASHGGHVELLGVTDGLVRLRLEGSCHGCPSSAVTLRNTIEEAVYAAAPEVTEIDVAGVVEHTPPPPGFVPMSQLLDGAEFRTAANGAVQASTR